MKGLTNEWFYFQWVITDFAWNFRKIVLLMFVDKFMCIKFLSNILQSNICSNFRLIIKLATIFIETVQKNS